MQSFTWRILNKNNFVNIISNEAEDFYDSWRQLRNFLLDINKPFGYTNFYGKIDDCCPAVIFLDTLHDQFCHVYSNILESRYLEFLVAEHVEDFSDLFSSYERFNSICPTEIDKLHFINVLENVINEFSQQQALATKRLRELIIDCS